MAEGNLVRVLRALCDAGVRFLVVGGVAVVLHGHLRVTRDLDLIVQLEPSNVRRAVAALRGLGYRPRVPVALDDLASAERRRDWIDTKGAKVFSVWSDQVRDVDVDIFLEEPLDFGVAWGRAVHASLGEIDVPVASIDDVIALKKSAGRPQDLLDIAALEMLRGVGGEARPDA